MTVTIYGFELSAPARSVMVTAKLLDVPHDFKRVDIMKGEQLQPDFLKMNPLHTVPVLDDDGFILFESHPIVLYLIAKYAKDDSFYPKDLEKQAIVQQRMFFNASTVFRRFQDAVPAALSTGSVPDDILAKATETLTQLETLLGDNDWIAGTPNFSVADICLLSSLENWTAAMPGIIDSFDKIVSWLQRGRETIPGYEEITRPAIKTLGKFFGTGTGTDE